jgi:hypothetical protein
VERWRNEGLLPRPIQTATYRDGAVCGSSVWHAPQSPLQVLALERALAAKHRLDDAGAVLWLGGFDVDERFWRALLMQRDKTFRSAAAKVARAVRALDETDSETVGDQFAGLGRFRGAIDKLARRLEIHELATAINVVVAVAGNDFEGFTPNTTDRDGPSPAEILLRGMDFEGGRFHHIHGQSINLVATLSGVLRDLSLSLRAHSLSDFSDQEILAARDDVRNGLKMALCMHDGMAWIYGPQAFGLRMAAFTARSATIDLMFGYVAAFARLRRRTNQFYSTEEIAELARQAENNWLMSGYFRDLQSHPEIQKEFGKRGLKKALRDSLETGNPIKEFDKYQYPRPEFRPWDQWRKLSKGTMSPGLLAMSIGAPEKLARADIFPSGSVDAIP